MTATVTGGQWNPIPGSLPTKVEADTVYVLPTREPSDDQGTVPRYMDNVRYLPKAARNASAPIEFAVTADSRIFLQEFSAAEAWSIALASAQIANAWFVLAVELFIQRRQGVEGWTREQAGALPLKVKVAKLDDGAVLLETYEFEGSGDDVLNALRALTEGHPHGESRGIEQ